VASVLSHLETDHPLFCTFRSGDESLQAFEELFIYACPKFIAANPPPYEDPTALQAYIDHPPTDPPARHLAQFLADVRSQRTVATLRSFLKLYTSLDAAKLAGFLDADEEEMVQQLMVLKQASRSISRVGTEKNLMDGQTISTSDLDFVIEGVRFFRYPYL
jgi:translation initiation factor 3 subunit L